MRFLAILSLVLLTLSSAQAQTNRPAPHGYGYGQPPRAYMPPPRPPVTGPADVLRKGVSDLQAFLARSGRPDTQAIQRYVEVNIAPAFDFSYMARASLGPSWHRLTPVNRAKAQAWLRRNFLEKLTQHIAGHRAARIDVGAHGNLGRGQMSVTVRVWRQNIPPTTLSFRFHRGPQGWRIFDVAANGQSAIVFYRGYINRMMRGTG